MMTDELTGESSSSGSGSGDDFAAVLQTLNREELLEILADGFCRHCQSRLHARIDKLCIRKKLQEVSSDDQDSKRSSETECSPQIPQSSNSSMLRDNVASHSSLVKVKKQDSFDHSDHDLLLEDGIVGVSPSGHSKLSEEQKERLRFSQVGRKKDLVHYEKIKGRTINILQGLELHTGVFNAEEQKNIIECVYKFQRMGQSGQLRARTYSEPRKWMRGKGRITIQFGCCYNYAVDKDGNPPGIIRDEQVDPLPPLFKQMIKRMVKWHVLPPTCVPDSCIVNIYEEGDCIPPHIDHHDFIRPFCTVSFLTECNILFGSNLKVVSPGDFAGPVTISLPVGSVLILNGNGADIAKHCIPAVPAKRISITFRKMDDTKLPYRFLPDPELQGIKPLPYSSSTLATFSQFWPKSSLPCSYERSSAQRNQNRSDFRRGQEADFSSANTNDFPPLGSFKAANGGKANRNGHTR